MFGHITYKEWLKIRWALYGLSALMLLSLIYTYAIVNYTYRFSDANGFWYNIIYRGSSFYSRINYLPLLAGLIIAAVQWVPEIQRKRIKLTFHLPVDEYRVLLQMIAFGASALAMIFIGFCVLFSILGFFYFPPEIVYSALSTLFPRFLLGMAAYLMAAYIILEPHMLRRILYSVLSIGFGKLFLYGWFYNIYDRILLQMTLLTLLLSLAIIYPGHRFKKGVMK